jgi:hypothetical protein
MTSPGPYVVSALVLLYTNIFACGWLNSWQSPEAGLSGLSAPAPFDLHHHHMGFWISLVCSFWLR